MSRTRKKDIRPVLQAVAMSRLPYAVRSITRRAFTGREAFLLESDGIPIAVVVSARDWLALMETRFPGIGAAVERAEFGTPYVRPEKRAIKKALAKKRGRKRPLKIGAEKKRRKTASGRERMR